MIRKVDQVLICIGLLIPLMVATTVTLNLTASGQQIGIKIVLVFVALILTAVCEWIRIELKKPSELRRLEYVLSGIYPVILCVVIYILYLSVTADVIKKQI